jgi:hypothetical protein
MYCRKIGLEYGEIDILRSDEDGKIYIIDVNNTPWWPPNKLSDIDRNIALNMMWNALIQEFFPEKMNTYYIPDEHLDDFVNYKKPEKNNRNRKIINQSQFRFIGKDYDFPYQKMRDELFANYKKKPHHVVKAPQSIHGDGKKKWVKKNQNGNPPSAQQVADVSQVVSQATAPHGKPQDKKHKKFQNKSK